MTKENSLKERARARFHKIKEFVSEHKGEIIGIGLSLVATAVIIVCNNEEKNEQSVRDRFYFDSKWMKNATDAELSEARERVRVEYASAGTSGLRDSDATFLQNTLRRFDKEMSDRAWEGKTEYGYPAHTKHGWYLSDDD